MEIPEMIERVKRNDLGEDDLNAAIWGLGFPVFFSLANNQWYYEPEPEMSWGEIPNVCCSMKAIDELRKRIFEDYEYMCSTRDGVRAAIWVGAENDGVVYTAPTVEKASILAILKAIHPC